MSDSLLRSAPNRLASRMELDLLGKDADRAYQFLASVVTPRPIAWVTTLNEDGTVNAAPFSFFNVFGANPPLVIFAPGNKNSQTPKDTARNCRRTGEFVINIVSYELAEAMNATAATHDYGVSETENAIIKTTPSSLIGPPRISAAPAALECKVHSIQEIGKNRLILGIVHRAHVLDDFFDAEKKRVLGEKLYPVGRMASPNWYCRTDQMFEMERPD